MSTEKQTSPDNDLDAIKITALCSHKKFYHLSALIPIFVTNGIGTSDIGLEKGDSDILSDIGSNSLLISKSLNAQAKMFVSVSTD